MFPDDLFLFGTLEDGSLQSLQVILFIYARWSGQQANLDESTILFGKGVSEDKRSQVAARLRVKQMESNDRYPGFQLLKPSYRVNSYNFQIEKFENKLAG